MSKASSRSLSANTKEPGCCPNPAPQPSRSECCPPPPSAAGQTSSACCPSQPDSDACGPSSAVKDDRPGYKLWPFVVGWLDTPIGQVPQVGTTLSRSVLFEHWQMRWGLGRMRYSIAPGIYAIGRPDCNSPVLVTANYKMTFDVLRRELQGRNLWLLVLDTHGINVWCAAGKGTFGTCELISRIKATRLGDCVDHHRLILPQLGAAGIAAHKVKAACGFQVVYGPVRASDLPEYLAQNLQATPEMRRVTFSAYERLVLSPVELVNAWKQVLWGIIVLLLLGGIGPTVFSFTAAWSRGSAAILAGLAGLLTGAVLTPLLLPWLPGRAFAIKGAVLGMVVATISTGIWFGTLNWLNSMALLIALPAVSSWFAMHFTGSTTYTSPSGVEKELRKAIPAQAAALLVAGISWITSAF
jgi:hypothetical protein